MDSAPQFFLVKIFKRRNYPPHFCNGADTQVPSAAVCGAASGYDLRPDESLVSKNKASFAGFREDASIRSVAFEKVLRADAGIFFIGHQGDKYPARYISVSESSRRRHDGGGTALHVIAAAPVDVITLNFWFKRRNRHTLRTYSVEVGAKDERGTSPFPHFSHGVRASRSGLFQPALYSVGYQQMLCNLGNRPFPVRLLR